MEHVDRGFKNVKEVILIYVIINIYKRQLNINVSEPILVEDVVIRSVKIPIVVEIHGF